MRKQRRRELEEPMLGQSQGFVRNVLMQIVIQVHCMAVIAVPFRAARVIGKLRNWSR
jgi:hypothetical protein